MDKLLKRLLGPDPPRIRWLSRPVWPCALHPQGRPGHVLIHGDLYGVLPLLDEAGVNYGFAVLRRGAEDGYQVTVEGWMCSCPDATYRTDKKCKHGFACRTAYAWRPR
jgi:hypothetical protein